MLAVPGIIWYTMSRWCVYLQLFVLSAVAAKILQIVLDSQKVLVYTTFAVENAARYARLAEQPKAEKVILPNVWPNRKVNMSL